MVGTKKIGASGLALVAAAMLFCQVPSAANAQPVLSTSETLLDRVNIEDMMVEYYTVLSTDDHTTLGQYFTEDAELNLEGRVIKGRDAIEKLYNQVRDAKLVPGTRNSTLLNNPRIAIHGDTAEMDALWTVVISDVVTAPPRLIEHGADHSEFVKRDGHWLITKRAIVSYSGR